MMKNKTIGLDCVKNSDVVFCSVAEIGAMGVPGEVVIVSMRNGVPLWTVCNYLFDVSIMELETLIPPLQYLRDISFNISQVNDLNWEYVDLGAGNHLFVHQNFYEKFKKEVEKMPIQAPSFVYRNWRDIVSRMLEE